MRKRTGVGDDKEKPSKTMCTHVALYNLSIVVVVVSSSSGNMVVGMVVPPSYTRSQNNIVV